MKQKTEFTEGEVFTTARGHTYHVVSTNISPKDAGVPKPERKLAQEGATIIYGGGKTYTNGVLLESVKKEE